MFFFILTHSFLLVGYNHNVPRAHEKRNNRFNLPSMWKKIPGKERNRESNQIGRVVKCAGSRLNTSAIKCEKKIHKPGSSASCQILCRLQYSKWNFYNAPNKKMRNPCNKNICACSSRELLLLALLLLQLQSFRLCCFI